MISPTLKSLAFYNDNDSVILLRKAIINFRQFVSIYPPTTHCLLTSFVTRAPVSEIKISNTVKRLRSVADAIESGESITDVALRINVPVSSLRNVCLPRPSRNAGRKPSINPAILAEAIARAQTRKSAKEIAQELQINPWTLSKALAKADATPRELRAERMKEAVTLYRQGARPKELAKRFGVSTTALYVHMRKAGLHGRRSVIGR
jgi:transposase-like protein